MKRLLSLLLFIGVLASLVGCMEGEPETSIAYTEPKFIPGSMETERLTVEKGNYNRANQANTIFLESASGYYAVRDNLLCYADKTDMNTWVPVCGDPACLHSTLSKCTAAAAGSGAFLREDRLYFLSRGEIHAHLYPEYKGMNASVLCSMTLNGTDLRAEHVMEDALLYDGGVKNERLLPGGYVIAVQRMMQDGNYRAELFRFDYTNGEQKLLTVDDVDESNSTFVFTVSGSSWYGMGGDQVLSTCMTGNPVPNDICWVYNNETVITDATQLPMFGSYLSGNILRCYKANDGYYDIDLLTGEETKLAETQLKNGHVRIFQPNCIFESTLPFTTLNSSQLSEGEKHMLRFFDGQQWHDVILPEEIQSFRGSQHLGGLALTSDRVMFMAIVDGEYRYYSMALDAEKYSLEHCGTFNK